MSEFYIDCEEGFDAAPLEKAFSARVKADVPLAAELLFVSGDEIRSLNARERKKDAVTDVLSFPNLSGILRREIRGKDFPYDLDEEGRLFLGSVVICRERAAEQAEEYGRSLRRELYYLAVHGLCHLLVHDHETEEDKRAMRAAEEDVLAEMGIGREKA